MIEKFQREGVSLQLTKLRRSMPNLLVSPGYAYTDIDLPLSLSGVISVQLKSCIALKAPRFLEQAGRTNHIYV